MHPVSELENSSKGHPRFDGNVQLLRVPVLRQIKLFLSLQVVSCLYQGLQVSIPQVGLILFGGKSKLRIKPFHLCLKSNPLLVDVESFVFVVGEQHG